MDGSYRWVECTNEEHFDVPPNMIPNKAMVDQDGLVTIAVANIMQDQLAELVKLLQT